MKTQHVARLTLGTVTSLAMLALALVTGCKTTNYVRSDETAGKLQATAAELRVATSNLDATLSALNDLLANPTGDLRIQYDRFSVNLDRLADSSKRAFDEGPKLQRLSSSYFAAWDKELATISDEQIRRTSTARKAEVTNQYASTIGAYQGCEKASTSLLRYLNDIRRALSTDLTIAGLQSVKQPVSSATENAAGARNAFGQAAHELDAMAAKMSFFVPGNQAQRPSGS